MILDESINMTKMVASIEVDNTSDYQIVYASQLYGTFFAIGAKLIIDDNNNLTGIDLALNNYKGLYNIGMRTQTKDNFVFKNRKALITLYLSADNGRNSSDLKRTLPMPLKNSIGISDIDELNFTRVVQSLTDKTAPAKHLDEGIFDSEFYTRNGKYIAKIERLDDYLPKPDMGKTKAPVSDDDVELTGDPDTNCMNSKVRLIKK